MCHFLLLVVVTVAILETLKHCSSDWKGEAEAPLMVWWKCCDLLKHVCVCVLGMNIHEHLVCVCGMVAEIWWRVCVCV